MNLRSKPYPALIVMKDEEGCKGNAIVPTDFASGDSDK